LAEAAFIMNHADEFVVEEVEVEAQTLELVEA
jgi:hypothetical protein